MLLGEMNPNFRWDYVLNDDSRRAYAGYLPCPFTKELTKQWFDEAKEGTDWKQPEGPMGPIPRKTAWMVAPGGCSCMYRYGRIEVEPQPFPPWMIQMMTAIMPLAGINDMGM